MHGTRVVGALSADAALLVGCDAADIVGSLVADMLGTEPPLADRPGRMPRHA